MTQITFIGVGSPVAAQNQTARVPQRPGPQGVPAMAEPRQDPRRAAAGVDFVYRAFRTGGCKPRMVTDNPPLPVALIRAKLNLREPDLAALLEENREHLYLGSKPDPQSAAEPALRQIRALVDDLIPAQGNGLPAWVTRKKAA